MIALVFSEHRKNVAERKQGENGNLQPIQNQARGRGLPPAAIPPPNPCRTLALLTDVPPPKEDVIAAQAVQKAASDAALSSQKNTKRQSPLNLDEPKPMRLV